MVPDYWIQLEQIFSQGEVVIVFQPWMAMEQERDNRKRDNRTPACGTRPLCSTDVHLKHKPLAETVIC